MSRRCLDHERLNRFFDDADQQVDFIRSDVEVRCESQGVHPTVDDAESTTTAPGLDGIHPHHGEAGRFQLGAAQQAGTLHLGDHLGVFGLEALQFLDEFLTTGLDVDADRVS